MISYSLSKFLIKYSIIQILLLNAGKQYASKISIIIVIIIIIIIIIINN